MSNNKHEIQIDLPAEVANNPHYCNLAMIAHGPNEVFIDFIAAQPNMPKARVQSRIVMSPENAKNLLRALRDNIMNYEKTFGEIVPKRPINQGNNGNDIPNPFMA